MSLNNIIQLKNINKKYDRVILQNINLDIESGDFVVFLGESGAGKSTFLQIIGLLDINYEGDYFFKDVKITKKNITDIRKKFFGFIFQLYYLSASLSIKDNIYLPFCYQDMEDVDKINERYEELINRLNLRHVLTQKTSTLSGGEKQRVSIARALIHDPEVIICDEPTGNLDRKNAEEVMNILLEENAKGKTVLIVTHDSYIASYAKKIYKIKNGELYEENLKAS